jgi:hypothetical protein
MGLKYYHFKGPHLENLFQKWDEILSWYEDEWDDLPYWYLERTNIGHLALSVYQLGGIPLQEFTCRKGKGAKNSSGRADLYMSIPNGSTRNIDLNIEAKQVWRSITARASSNSVIKAGLGKAVHDCRRLKEAAWRARYGLGVLFLLPYGKSMPANIAEVRRQKRSFSTFVSEQSRMAGANFAAIHFPKISTVVRICGNYGDYSWCPCIAVIGKLVR